MSVAAAAPLDSVTCCAPPLDVSARLSAVLAAELTSQLGTSVSLYGETALTRSAGYDSNLSLAHNCFDHAPEPDLGATVQAAAVEPGRLREGLAAGFSGRSPQQLRGLRHRGQLPVCGVPRQVLHPAVRREHQPLG